jgi:thioredoxin reductase (NADPH)
MIKASVAIIGAGPAGISCVLELSHLGVDCIIVEKDKVGGLLNNAFLVKNYPGFSKGLSGKELVKMFVKHLKSHHVRILKAEAKSVRYKQKFISESSKGKIISDFLVVASGTKPKSIDRATTLGFKGKIFYEIKNFPYFGKLKTKTVAILGAGDCAFDYALSLSKAKRVFVLNRTKRYKCNPWLYKEVKKRRNVKVVNDFDVSSLPKLKADYLFIAVGREPNADFFPSKLKRNKKAFLIGDVKNDIFRQTAICAGDGIRSAMEIYKILSLVD